VAAFPELIEQTGGGLVYDSPNPEALANALEDLLLNPTKAQELGQAGREAVTRDFSMERMAERVLHVYEELLPTAAS
jgi:glycosyltransferase involved in cell wall biosynthesis